MADRNSPDSNAPVSEDSGVRAGEMLRAARLDRGMSSADVAAALHLDARTVENLEAENAAALPPPTFTRGYYKSYARLLGMEAELVLEAYSRRHRAESAERPLKVSAPVQTSPEIGRGLTLLAVGVILAGLLGGGGYWYYEQQWSVQPQERFADDDRMPAVEDPDTADRVAGERAAETESESDPEVAWQAGADEELLREAPAEQAIGEGMSREDDMATELSADVGIADEPDPDPEPAFTDDLAGPRSPEELGDEDLQGELFAAIPAPEELTSLSTGSDPREESPDPAVSESPPVEVDPGAESAAGAQGESGDTAAGEPRDAAGSNGGALVLEFSGPSWVEVYDDAGDRLMYGLIEEEGTRTVRGQPPFSVVIGDAENVAVQYRGDPVDLGQRRPGRVARLQVPQ